MPALLAAALLFITATAPAAAEAASATAETHLARRAAWAADYLHQSVLPSGRFVYRRDLASGQEIGGRYNLLRHAGTLYALADYHRSVEPNAQQSDNLRRAARFLVDCCVGAVAGMPGAVALWSDPALTGSRFPHVQAKLGGAGLTLVALTTLDGILPGVTNVDVWRGLGEFILAMQRSDGGFVSKYVPARGGPDTGWDSLYYPGEAALGLVMLFEHDPDPRWLQGAMDALRHLSRERERSTGLPADHWALIASARLFAVDPATLAENAPAAVPWFESGEVSGLRSALLAHASRLVESIVAEQIPAAGNTCLGGGFDQQGRVAPTATRLEGLIAALELLPPGPTRERAETATVHGLAFLLEAQQTYGPLRGAVTRVSAACPATEPRAREVRVDTVQHVLSALLGKARHIVD
jgi:hypothetical protein